MGCVVACVCGLPKVYLHVLYLEPRVDVFIHIDLAQKKLRMLAEAVPR